MLGIPKKDYEPVEQRAGLLLHIGRDSAVRGRGGFNLDYELGHGDARTGHALSGKARRRAYEWLIAEEMIRVTKEETVRDADGIATFVRLELTPKGQQTYNTLERFYAHYIEDAKDTFSALTL